MIRFDPSKTLLRPARFAGVLFGALIAACSANAPAGSVLPAGGPADLKRQMQEPAKVHKKAVE